MTDLRAKTVFSDRNRSVTVLESVQFRSGQSNHTCFVYGSVEPIAVVIKGHDTTSVLDMEGRPVDLEPIEVAAGFDLA